MLQCSSVRLCSIPPAFTDREEEKKTSNTRSQSIRAADKCPEQRQNQLPPININIIRPSIGFVCVKSNRAAQNRPPLPQQPPRAAPWEHKEAAAGDQQLASALILLKTTIHPNISSGAAPTPQTCRETQTQKQKFRECEVTRSYTLSPQP